MYQIQDWREAPFKDGEFVAVEGEFTNHILAHQELKRLKMMREVSSKAIVVLVPSKEES